MSQIESKLNYIQVVLLVVLLTISGICSLGYYIIMKNNHLR